MSFPNETYTFYQYFPRELVDDTNMNLDDLLINLCRKHAFMSRVRLNEDSYESLDRIPVRYITLIPGEPKARIKCKPEEAEEYLYRITFSGKRVDRNTTNDY